MNRDKSKRQSIIKTTAAAGLIIAASTLMFQGITSALTGAEFGKTSTLPANYTIPVNDPVTSSDAVPARSSLKRPSSAPQTDRNPSYTVREIEWKDRHTVSPTSKDMTKEAAADIGAQTVWSMFGVDLDGQVIEMSYVPANEVVPRSRWSADVLIDGERRYGFTVDSVTGELFTVYVNRTLEQSVSVAFDPALDKQPEEFEQLAKELAETYDVVHGAVESVRYQGQGYINNDPSISVEVSGTNGEVAIMTFSRYDQALLGISYHPEYKFVREHDELMLQKIQEKERELGNAGVGQNHEQPVLKAIDLD